MTCCRSSEGNDSLGLAVAFYGSDHPYYGDPFAYQYSLELPSSRDDRSAAGRRSASTIKTIVIEWTERNGGPRPDGYRQARIFRSIEPVRDSRRQAKPRCIHGGAASRAG